MSRPITRSFRLSLLAVGLLGSGMALAEARVDAALVQKLAAAAPTDELQVVITYAQSTPVSAAQVDVLEALGIDTGVTMRTLPIAGALATPAQIAALAKRGDVASIWHNAPLRYFNKEAREISGAARVVENSGDWNRAIPYSGAGVTVVVNDSGIDFAAMTPEQRDRVGVAAGPGESTNVDLVFRPPACVLAVPEDWYERIAGRVGRRPPAEVFDVSLVHQVFGSAVDRVIGPAWLGYADASDLRPAPTMGTRLLAGQDLAVKLVLGGGAVGGVVRVLGLMARVAQGRGVLRVQREGVREIAVGELVDGAGPAGLAGGRRRAPGSRRPGDRGSRWWCRS